MDPLETVRRPQGRSRISQIAKLLDVGVIWLDPALQPDVCSERALDLLGEPRGAGGLSSTTLRVLLRHLGLGTGRWKAQTEEDAAAPDSELRKVDLDLETNEGLRRLRLQLHGVPEDECQLSYLILIRDRSVLDAVETDLRMAAKLRGLNRLYRGVAHDLKAPLNAMRLNLDLLSASLNGSHGTGKASNNGSHKPGSHKPGNQSAISPGVDTLETSTLEASTLEAEASEAQEPEAQEPEARRCLKVIEGELQRLQRSLQQLLDQTAPALEGREVFELGQLVKDIVEFLTPEATQRRVEIELHLPNELVPLFAHRDSIHQVVINLAVNALDAMPNGGRLSFEVEHSEGQGILRVTDTGPGIPTELADRIFDMHFTTKSSGTGIGLHVSVLAARHAGGRLTLLTRDERGAETGASFELRLPLTKEY